MRYLQEYTANQSTMRYLQDHDLDTVWATFHACGAQQQLAGGAGAGAGAASGSYGWTDEEGEEQVGGAAASAGGRALLARIWWRWQVGGSAPGATLRQQHPSTARLRLPSAQGDREDGGEGESGSGRGSDESGSEEEEEDGSDEDGAQRRRRREPPGTGEVNAAGRPLRVAAKLRKQPEEAPGAFEPRVQGPKRQRTQQPQRRRGREGDDWCQQAREQSPLVAAAAAAAAAVENAADAAAMPAPAAEQEQQQRWDYSEGGEGQGGLQEPRSPGGRRQKVRQQGRALERPLQPACWCSQ